MIVDHIKNSERYTQCHENIKTALSYLRDVFNGEVPEDGVYALVPDQVIAHVVTMNTTTENNMEIHKKFMDIHYIISGAERCGVAPCDENVQYEEEKDVGFYKCEDSYNVRIGEGEFYMVWPMEPHRPASTDQGQPQTIRKIICKIKVD